MPGAGAGKGIVALPDVDDRVLVLLPQRRPGGGDRRRRALRRRARRSTPGSRAAAVKRWSVLTPGGQRVVLDDDQGRVVGRQPRRQLRRARPRPASPCTPPPTSSIEAPGKTMTLRANRIELVAGDRPRTTGRRRGGPDVRAARPARRRALRPRRHGRERGVRSTGSPSRTIPVLRDDDPEGREIEWCPNRGVEHQALRQDAQGRRRLLRLRPARRQAGRAGATSTARPTAPRPASCTTGCATRASASSW